MKNYKIKVRVVFNGEYSVINIDKMSKDINDKNIKSYLKDKVKSFTLMNRYVYNKYKIKTNFEKNLCGDCKNMLNCPKVIDVQKGALKKYPYITNGIQIILVNNEINDIYNNSVKRYSDLKDNKDFNLDHYPTLEKKLSNNGMDFIHFSVFECSKFVDDNNKTSIENFKEEESSPQKCLNNINKMIKNVE